jgi:hypothetical protein
MVRKQCKIVTQCHYLQGLCPSTPLPDWCKSSALCMIQSLGALIDSFVPVKLSIMVLSSNGISGDNLCQCWTWKSYKYDSPVTTFMFDQYG